jgi:Ca2+-binding RTX toxin-like protein
MLSWQEGDHDRVGDDHRDRCNDVIVGSDGADIIDGGGGDDLICALGEDDTIVGGLGDDRIDGGDGNDSVRGDVLASALTLLVEATTSSTGTQAARRRSPTTMVGAKMLEMCISMPMEENGQRKRGRFFV